MAGPWVKYNMPGSAPPASGPWSRFQEPAQAPIDVAMPESRGGFLDTVIPKSEPLPAGRVNPELGPIESVLGKGNPISKTIEIGGKAINPSSDRPLLERAQDTLNFMAAAPFRMFRAPTPGDALEAIGLGGANESERRFVDNNPDLLRGLGAAGEVAGFAGAGIGLGMGAGGVPLRAPEFPGQRTIARARANQGEAGAYGTIADDLPGTVDDLANSVATGATGANVARNRRTLDILGEEMQRNGGNVQAAQAATIARIVDEVGVTPQTAARQIRDLVSVQENNRLMFGEYPAVAASDAAQRLRQPGNVDLDELGRLENTTTQATLDYLANNGNAQSAQNVRNAIARRQEDLAPYARETLEEVGPQVQTGPRTTRPATIVDTADMVDHARNVGRQEYQNAYRQPVNNRVALYWLPRILDAQRNRAVMRAGEPRAAIERALDQFYIDLPTGQRMAMSTLQQLQDARGALRGQISGYIQSGRRDLAGAVQPIYDQITRLMTRMSPQWRVANDRWADMRFMEIAQELGDTFANKAGPRYREQLAEFTRLAPEAQNIVRVHFLQQFFDKLDNLGDSHSISKLWANDHSRNMVRTLFGDEAAIDFTRMVRDQKVAERSNSMTQNSATHRRGVAQRQKDAETGLVAAVNNASVHGARNWIVERLTQLLTERRNRPMAEILTTPMNDTAAVARHLYRMREQQRRLAEIERGRQMGTLRPVPLAGGGVGLMSLEQAYQEQEDR